ncbi:hypothetical protein, partial [Paraburkholderia piptadeniae]|uniref:hypothetical protein n=1 Tax=Paraburkholderia piptadeniae TaxID=1701573 RepID=UPI001C4651FC
PHVLEAGQAFIQDVGNEHKPAHCCAKHGDVESPWVKVKHWRCERLSFAYFSLPLQRKVGAAPHRGNARAARRIADAIAKAKAP